MSAEIQFVDEIRQGDWARICRIEAARTTNRETRDFLLELAAKYEALAGRSAVIHPDDHELQSAVAERLHASAEQRKSAQSRMDERKGDAGEPHLHVGKGEQSDEGRAPY